MSLNKITSQSDIINYYIHYVLRHNEQPKTVYTFAKDNNFEEQKFYEFFISFESIEQSIFKIFFDNTFNILDKSENYHSFDAHNKLLSFYYTFFEILTANRGYVVYVLEGNKSQLKSLRSLARLKKRFFNYIEYLNIKTIDLKQEQLVSIKKRALNESAWLQLLITMKFWLDDTSTSFEKTDLLIEKSVKASFDLVNTMPLRGIMDFSKLLYKERMQLN